MLNDIGIGTEEAKGAMAPTDYTTSPLEVDFPIQINSAKALGPHRLECFPTLLLNVRVEHGIINISSLTCQG